MKIITTLCSLCLVVAVKAQTIKLNYQPKGVIVVFNYDSITIFTDTTSIFDAINNEDDKDVEGVDDYDKRIRNLILAQIKKSPNDTINFHGYVMPFEDGIHSHFLDEWYVHKTIVQLTNKNKLEIFDQFNQRVQTIYTKKIHNKDKTWFGLSYRNKKTKKELFDESLHWVIIDPRF